MRFVLQQFFGAEMPVWAGIILFILYLPTLIRDGRTSAKWVATKYRHMRIGEEVEKRGLQQYVSPERADENGQN